MRIFLVVYIGVNFLQENCVEVIGSLCTLVWPLFNQQHDNVIPARKKDRCDWLG
jgi:hypothetical protein